MKVAVYIDRLDDVLKTAVESFIHDSWPSVSISSGENDSRSQNSGNGEATLILSTGRADITDPKTEVTEVVVANGISVQELLYLVNAKLGRLTNSDIKSSDGASSVGSPVTRREFLFGIFGRPRPANTSQFIPVVSSETCEARFGCTKCLDICPAPGALELRENSVAVSKEQCIGCGLCASICPVAAIQAPDLPDMAYQGLLQAIQDSPAPRKTLVITCNKKKVPKAHWVDVEEVSAIGMIGVRQLALAASTSIGATVVYCADGLCTGKEHARKAVELIRSVAQADPPSVYYVEGESAAIEIERIHNSVPNRTNGTELTGTPWKNYTASIERISMKSSQSTGLGITDIEIAETCTLCGACVEKCPHNALGLKTGELIFNSAACTGCGYCEEICPEHSITLRELQGSITFAEKPVYSDEMIKCSKCNTPYASAKMIRKLSATLQNEMPPICPTCREIGMYDELFRKTSLKLVN